MQKERTTKKNTETAIGQNNRMIDHIFIGTAWFEIQCRIARIFLTYLSDTPPYINERRHWQHKNKNKINETKSPKEN